MGKGRQTTWGINTDAIGFKRRYFDIGKKNSYLGYDDKTKRISIEIDENAPADMKQSERMIMWRKVKEIFKVVPNQPDICSLDLIPIRCKKGGGLQAMFSYYGFVNERPSDEQYEAMNAFLKKYF